MFNNIIYFIFVLLLFNISYHDNPPESSLGYTLIMPFLTWLVYAGICRWGFQRLLDPSKGDRHGDGRLSSEYQGLVLRLSVLAIFLFALDVYIFHLKYWLQVIPGFRQFSVLGGGMALMLFIFI